MAFKAYALALYALTSLSVAAPIGIHHGRTPRVVEARGRADSSPHRSAFVTHHGVRLHYLDWGGTKPVVVLLPGYALTAHAFDDIGRLLASEFRVIAVTPRGFGQSDAPNSGDYTIGTMVEDLRALLDSLSIQHAALIGHSISGSTITEVARAYPDTF